MSAIVYFSFIFMGDEKPIIHSIEPFSCKTSYFPLIYCEGASDGWSSLFVKHKLPESMVIHSLNNSILVGSIESGGIYEMDFPVFCKIVSSCVGMRLDECFLMRLYHARNHLKVRNLKLKEGSNVIRLIHMGNIESIITAEEFLGDPLT